MSETDVRPTIQRDHLACLTDTHNAYTQFHGWVLSCLWCDHKTYGVTKADAVAGMQQHYDEVCGLGRTEISAGAPQ